MIMSDQSLERYVADIQRTARLAEDEELRLIREAQAGSLEARNRLIRSHLRFVLKVALHYRKAPVPPADLIGEGVLGLSRAVDSFKPTGIKFISYAVWWIRSFMVRAIEDRGAVIRLPANEHARLRKSKKAALAEGKGAGWEEGWVRAVTLQDPLGRDPWADVPDRGPGPEDYAEERLLEGEVGRLLGELPANEGRVIRSLYGIGCQEADTLLEVAEDMGLSSERVRQLREKALRRMRD